jgi:hypothetical protein
VHTYRNPTACSDISIHSTALGLLNLRGSDIQYNPIFFPWVLVKMNGEIHLFVDPSKVTLLVRQHLNLEADVEMEELAWILGC